MPSLEINKSLYFQAFRRCLRCTMCTIMVLIKMRRPDLVLFADTDGDVDLTTFRPVVEHLMAMNSAPGWNIVQDAGIGCSDNKGIPCCKVPDTVLGPDHRQGTEQSSCVQGVFRHASCPVCPPQGMAIR